MLLQLPVAVLLPLLLLDLGGSFQFRRLLLEGPPEEEDSWSPDGRFEMSLQKFTEYVQARKNRRYCSTRVDMSDIRAVLTASARC